MKPLAGWQVTQTPDLAADVAGCLLAALGAHVTRPDVAAQSPLEAVLNRNKHAPTPDGPSPDIVLADKAPDALSPETTRVAVTPYGIVGPGKDRAASDLTLFCGSGIARLLTGQAEDPKEPPTRATGNQSAFIAGIAAATAAVLAEIGRRRGAAALGLDVSAQEALGTVAIQELAQASLNGRSRSRIREGDGNGSTVCILPASDGYVAISPREEAQWSRWLEVMGSPAWGHDPRFERKPGRSEHWDEVHDAMSAWSRALPKHEIARLAQAAHVPSFPLCPPEEHIDSAQLSHRAFFTRMTLPDGTAIAVPTSPFRFSAPTAETEAQALAPAGEKPLAGIRVLDFSWVIAGPTTTRYLAAMGAEVIKVEAPGRGDPGRSSELHTVLGQDKEAIVLDLKSEAGVETALELAGHCDVLIENFATGVMERFGLGPDTVHAANPGLVYVSASGMGRTGPQARAVAYGTLLQCYSGFAELNGVPGYPPRVGMAWLDPMCGLLLALATGAGLAHRLETGAGARVDFSMVEAMLWTMVEPLLEAQGVVSGSNHSLVEGVYPCKGADAWVGIPVATSDQWEALDEQIGSLELTEAALTDPGAGFQHALTQWAARHTPREIEAACAAAGIACHEVVSSLTLLEDEHLRSRGFWERSPSGVLPGLPWRTTLPREPQRAPALAQDTAAVLNRVLGLDQAAIDRLRARGALGE